MGQEWDLTLGWAPPCMSPHGEFLFGYSYFVPGAYVERLGDSDHFFAIALRAAHEAGRPQDEAGLAVGYADALLRRLRLDEALRFPQQALALAHRGYVLATGENRYTDTGAALLANREVAESFLGGHA